MKDLINFLKEREDISIHKIETDLKLPNATINTRKEYITPKHVDAIRKYLIKHYGYESNLKEVIYSRDNRVVNPNLSMPTVKMYNVGRIPGFKDSLHRFQDKQGLWRRLAEECMTLDKDNKTGPKILKKAYEPQSDEIPKDHIGSFYIANNGIKVYTDFLSTS